VVELMMQHRLTKRKIEKAVTKTGRRSDYRKLDELAAWDIDKGSRAYIDTSTPARRRLRDRLRRRARKRINKMMWKREVCGGCGNTAGPGTTARQGRT